MKDICLIGGKRMIIREKNMSTLISNESWEKLKWMRVVNRKMISGFSNYDLSSCWRSAFSRDDLGTKKMEESLSYRGNHSKKTYREN